MSQISPLLTSIVQTSQVQIQQSDEVSRSRRNTELVRKDAASTNDEEPEAIENTDAIVAIHDQPSQSQDQRKPKHHHYTDDASLSTENEHLDLTA